MATKAESIFQGIPPSDSRKKIAEFVQSNRANIKKVIVPCCGRFACVNVIVNSGINPKDIITSDISLYSSILGYTFANKNLKDLGIKYHGDVESFKNEEDQAAAALLGIKYGQINPKSYYNRSMKKEILLNRKIYIQRIRGQLDEINKKLNGLQYTCRDLVEEFMEHKDQEGNFIFLNPPAYKGGYTKMFNVGESVTWNEPKIVEFDPKLRKNVLECAENSEAIVLCYHNIPDINRENLWEGVEHMNKIFVRRYTELRRDYLLCNRVSNTTTIRQLDHGKPKRFPLFSDQDLLNKFTKVGIKVLDRDTSTYYRNLFIHKLSGKTSAQANFGMFLDGKLFTVFGMDMNSALKDGDSYIFEVYGISVPSGKWKRFNRLFMRLLLSSETKEWMLRNTRGLEMAEIRGIKTTCLSRYPEVRINNGLLKKLNCEKFKDGFKIQYYSDFYPKSYKAMIIEYIDEHNKFLKTKEKEEEEGL